MINSLNNSSTVNQLYTQQQGQTTAAHKNKTAKPEKQDTVELSQQAQAAAKQPKKA